MARIHWDNFITWIYIIFDIIMKHIIKHKLFGMSN